MATTSTDFTWYWYIRKKGKNWVLGLVDENGDAATGILDIEYWFDAVPDEITGDDDILDIPTEYEHPFMMGVVHDILRMIGVKSNRDVKILDSYKKDWEDGIYDAVHKNVQETQQPLVQKPLDIRMDDVRHKTRSPDL